MQALINALLHFRTFTPSFKMFSIPSIHPIRGLPHLISPILSALYIILVILSRRFEQGNQPCDSIDSVAAHKKPLSLTTLFIANTINVHSYIFHDHSLRFAPVFLSSHFNIYYLCRNKLTRDVSSGRAG
jgi:hypothetical protein